MTSDVNHIFSEAECFLWDFDGCFADTERVHFLAYKEAFAQFDHTIIESEYYPSFTHLGDGTRREIARHALAISEEEVLRLKAESYARLIRQGPVNCFPETLSIVRCMRARGARVAIASNSSEDDIRIVLQTAKFPVGEIDLIVGKTPHLPKKPAPDIFLHALERLGCHASRAVVLEDSNRGLQAAVAARCAPIWVKTSYNENLQSTEPFVAALTHHQILKLCEAI